MFCLVCIFHNQKIHVYLIFNNLLSHERFRGCHEDDPPLRVPSVKVVHHNSSDESFAQASWKRHLLNYFYLI